MLNCDISCPKFQDEKFGSHVISAAIKYKLLESNLAALSKERISRWQKLPNETLLSLLLLVKKIPDTSKRRQHIRKSYAYENHLRSSNLFARWTRIYTSLYISKPRSRIGHFLKKFHSASNQEQNTAKIYFDFSLER